VKTADGVAASRRKRWIASVLNLPSLRCLRSEASDLRQDILSRILESLRQRRFDAGRDFRAYVQSIARYAAGEARRRRVTHPGVAPGDVELTADRDRTPEERLVLQDLARDAMAVVSPEAREAIRLIFFEERSYAEAAAEMRIPVGTLKNRIFRCLRRARRSKERPRTPE
jgi:RNA polymerase sigma-70 factor (ECF subfamily)